METVTSTAKCPPNPVDYNQSEMQNSTGPNIGIVAPFPFPIDRGSPLRARGLIEAIPQQYNVHVITYHLGNQASGDYSVHRIPRLPIEFYDSGASIKKGVCDAFLLYKLLRVTRSLDLDILHGHLHEGCAVSSLVSRLSTRSLPVIFDSHGPFVEELIDTGFIRENSLQLPFWRWLETRIETSADYVIANSPSRMRALRDNSISAEKITVIPDCIDTEFFSPSPPAEDLADEFSMDLSSPLIVYTGSIHEFQGIDDLLVATAELVTHHPDLQLLLVGGGDIDRFKALADDLDISSNVVFAGSQPYEQMPDFISLADLTVVPRKSNRQNLPLKLFTYMSMGKPSVVADIRSVFDVVSPEEDVLIYTAEAPDSLAEQCLELIENPDKRNALGHNAREKVLREYSYEAAGEKLDAVYTKLLQNASGA